MKTILCHKINEDISSVSFDEVTIAPPSSNEVQIRVMVCSVNFPDVLMIQGKYQFAPPLPFAPGGELSGEVIAVGAQVKQFEVGERVVASTRFGGFSEKINAKAEMVKPIPKGISFEKAAAYQTAYLTAYVALTIRGNLKADETLLVHGATG